MEGKKRSNKYSITETLYSLLKDLKTETDQKNKLEKKKSPLPS